ncbi:unnamed protein product [Cochlearia groenlandica]
MYPSKEPSRVQYSFGHASIKSKSQTNRPCSNCTKEKAKTSRRSQSSKPRCNYKEKLYHYELKAVPKTVLFKFKEVIDQRQEGSSKKKQREGKIVIMFGPKSNTQVCEEQTVKTKSKNQRT